MCLCVHPRLKVHQIHTWLFSTPLTSPLYRSLSPPRLDDFVRQAITLGRNNGPPTIATPPPPPQILCPLAASKGLILIWRNTVGHASLFINSNRPSPPRTPASSSTPAPLSCKARAVVLVDVPYLLCCIYLTINPNYFECMNVLQFKDVWSSRVGCNLKPWWFLIGSFNQRHSAV